MAAFIPYDIHGAFSTPTITQSQYVHRTILDIRETNEFIMAVPYTSVANYYPTDGTQQSIGNFRIYILDKLVAPDTVVPKVDVIIEVYGGEDLEYAMPKQIDWQPYGPNVPQSAQYDPTLLQAGVVGDAKISIDNKLSHARMCMGEVITSLRSLLKVPLVWDITDKTAWSVPTTETDIWPWTIPFTYYLTPTTVSDSPLWPDYFTHIGCAYAMMRGSIDFYIDYQTDSKTVSRLTKWNPETPQAFIYGKGTLTDPFFSYKSIPVVIENTAVTGGVQIKVPYYSTFPSVATMDAKWTSAAEVASLKGTTLPNYYLQTYNFTAGTSYVRRSAGDDFSFGMFSSIPPMLII